MEEAKKEPLGADDIEVWNELWNAAHDVHYRCYFEELCAEFLVSRWRLIDSVSKFLTAATASTSAIAAWTIWLTSTTTEVSWAIISGIAALLALIHSSLGITERIKEDTLVFATFQQLRLDLETFQLKMKIREYDKLSQCKSDYLDIRAKFGKCHALKRPDFILTQKHEADIQEQLNKSLGF